MMQALSRKIKENMGTFSWDKRGVWELDEKLMTLKSP